MSKTDRSEQASLEGYEVLLCVTGGIACYKCADLTSKLVQAGAGVTVAMTDSAQQFITPLTFQTLSARQVYTSVWQSSREYDTQHISLTDLADLMVVAPATANIMAKLAHGIADDLVSSLALSSHGQCDILLAPAMNTRMWEAPATQDNLQRLLGWGVHTIGPNEGFLACRSVGRGRMAEPAEILSDISRLLVRKPAKKHHTAS
jgi:phosphopantothenoylcysteine decarboxylase/phosphopantothenate--cysteine ligase